MSKVKGFKALELTIVFILFLWAIYFSKDTLEKFSSKRTGFSTHKESRTDFPTTVLCFDPITKKSFLSQYNMTIKDFTNSWYPDNLYEVEFGEFKNAAYFILGKDYNISMQDNEYNQHILKEGNNTINEIEGKYLIVKQLMTVWNGMCLKIKFEYFSLDLAPTFNIAFSKSLTLADVPTPEVYLTSEENAYGIINYGWVNGEELKIVLEGVEQGIKLYASHRKFINYTSTCRKFLTTSCEKDKLAKIDFSNVSDPCLAVSLPSSIMRMNEINHLSTDCKDITNFLDSLFIFSDYLQECETQCEKHCSEITYSGKVTWIIKSGKAYDVSWENKFASDNVEIHEEYVLMDLTGVIGGLGGTLGLFIGFSFRDIVAWILQGLQKLFQRRQTPLKSKIKPRKSSLIKNPTQELPKVEITH